MLRVTIATTTTVVSRALWWLIFPREVNFHHPNPVLVFATYNILLNSRSCKDQVSLSDLKLHAVG